MAIRLDDGGNFVFKNGLLDTTETLGIQSAMCEARCNQGEWSPDPLYGKNVLVWELSSSFEDRCKDLFSICEKYFPVQLVLYNSTLEKFTIQ